MKLKLFLFLMISSFLLHNCASTDQNRVSGESDKETGVLIQDMDEESAARLNESRTKLSDAYSTRKNEIPEAFSIIRQENEVDRNIYEGFRIQIYSGKNVSQADTIASRFRVWSDSTFSGYEPQTYVLFRTPYYRVHVGDFHEKNKAERFTDLVKRYFKDAWVVYDRVNPNAVPPDTLHFYNQN